MITFLLLFLNLNLSQAADYFAPEKKIALELGCQATLYAEDMTTMICFRDDVLDAGLATETKGCSVRLYNLEQKKYVNFKYSKTDEVLLTPKECLSGGVEDVLNWPIDESTTLRGYILSAYGRVRTKIADVVNEKSPLDNIIREMLRARTLESGRIAGLPQAAGAPAPVFQEKITKNTSVEVFYGTDRQFVQTDIPRDTFNNIRSANEEVTLGKVSVSIPMGHKFGQLELPSVFNIQITPNPDQYVVLKSVTRLNSETFFSQLSRKVNASPKKDLFVFIHGFNTSFEEAALRTAQMAFDLKFPGAPVFYSWPAETILRYAIAEKNVEWALPHLTTFLRDLAKKSGAEEIHLIAHSMGNRALTNALNQLAQKKMLEPNQTFQNVILAAPDVDQSLFRQIEKSVKSTARNITLYATSYDRALHISARIHKEPRLGQAGNLTVVSPMMDTIDATIVDTSLMGHSYYGDNPSVVTDISQLVVRALPVNQRPSLIPKMLPTTGQRYWQISN